MSLDEMLEEMGACDRAREVWVDWCDDSTQKAAETLVRMMGKVKAGCPQYCNEDFTLGAWWLSKHLCNVDFSTQLLVLDEIERAVRMLRPYRVDEWIPVDEWVANLRREVRKAEDTRYVHWTSVMGRRQVS